MLIKGIVDEDFVNYKIPSMFICTSYCDLKCDKESGKGCCQNSPLLKLRPISVTDEDIIKRYLLNDITHAIVFGGLEPFMQFDELYQLIRKFRITYFCSDTVVIYTGYNRSEIEDRVNSLAEFDNIIIKFGRFVPDDEKRFDDILGVELASRNQYAEKIKKLS